MGDVAHANSRRHSLDDDYSNYRDNATYLKE
jgi:hypothetical protein